jgi:hypothetical protein
MTRPIVTGLRTLAAAAVLAALAPAGQAADNPNGFVRNDVALNQTITDLVDGRFYERVRCLEACVVTTQIGIAAADARRLGFPNVGAGSTTSSATSVSGCVQARGRRSSCRSTRAPGSG